MCSDYFIVQILIQYLVAITLPLPLQAFSMAEDEHQSLTERVQNTEVSTQRSFILLGEAI
jgi:hypothetical protein